MTEHALHVAMGVNEIRARTHTYMYMLMIQKFDNTHKINVQYIAENLRLVLGIINTLVGMYVTSASCRFTNYGINNSCVHLATLSGLISTNNGNSPSN